METVKEQAEEAGAVTPAAMDVSSNAAPSVLPGKTDPNLKYADEDVESEEGIDEEEALLVALEKEKEKEDAEEKAHPHDQPRDVTAAPRMLQDALKKGLVTASDSEEEEIKIKEGVQIAAASPEKRAAIKDESVTQEEKKGDDEHPHGEPHYHARVRSKLCLKRHLVVEMLGQRTADYCILLTTRSENLNILFLLFCYRKTSWTFSCRGLLNTQTSSPVTFKSYSVI